MKSDGVCRLCGKSFPDRIIFIALALVLFLLIIGCERDDEKSNSILDWSRNGAAILSPDGSQVAFIRYFDYISCEDITLASALIGSGYKSVYTQTSLYILSLSTMKLTKLPNNCEQEHIVSYISWEGNLIAYKCSDTIYVINDDGTYKSAVKVLSKDDGLFTLSGDAQWVVYLIYISNESGIKPNCFLHYINLIDNDKSFEVELPESLYIDDMIWSSGQNCILLVDYYPLGEDDIMVLRINADGTNLAKSEQGIEEIRRRRMFGELDNLTKNISYEEWGVPSPDDFG